MRKINIEIHLDEPVTSEAIFEAVQNINGQDCVQMANLGVDDGIWVNGSTYVFRPE
jgi:hypothetical protein